MPYILNRRPKPKPPQNNVMTIYKALKAVNDTMDWTVLFIVLLLVMVRKEHRQMLSFVVTDFLLFYIYNLVYLSESTLFYVQETYKLFLLP